MERLLMSGKKKSDPTFFHSRLVKQAEKVLILTCSIAVMIGAGVNFYMSHSTQTDTYMKLLTYDFKAAKNSLFSFIGSGYDVSSVETQKALTQLKADLGLERIFLTHSEKCNKL